MPKHVVLWTKFCFYNVPTIVVLCAELSCYEPNLVLLFYALKYFALRTKCCAFCANALHVFRTCRRQRKWSLECLDLGQRTILNPVIIILRKLVASQWVALHLCIFTSTIKLLVKVSMRCHAYQCVLAFWICIPWDVIHPNEHYLMSFIASISILDTLAIACNAP